jgi:hypothetical protein
MRTILLVAALVFALIAAAFGFDVFHTDSDPHLVGWVGLSLACYFGSLLDR